MGSTPTSPSDRDRPDTVLTMAGYDRRTFLVTGIAEIALAVFLALWIADRRPRSRERCAPGLGATAS